MIRPLGAHPDDEKLALYADGLLHSREFSDVEAHVVKCEQCRTAVIEARRGLAILAKASRPPRELEQSARSRRWAAARNPFPLPTGADESADEDIAEVSGRHIGQESSDDEPQDGDDPVKPEE